MPNYSSMHEYAYFINLFVTGQEIPVLEPSTTVILDYLAALIMCVDQLIRQSTFSDILSLSTF